MLAGLLLLAPAARQAAAAYAPVKTAQSSPATLAAKLLSAKIDAHYNKLHSLSVQFTQSYDGMGMHRVERGTLLLSKSGRLHAGKMRWTYSQPAGKLFVLDGKDAYFYTPGQSEAQRVPAKQLLASGDDLRSPLALLLGHAALARQLAGLTLTPLPDSLVGSASGDSTLSGVPRGLERRVARLSVTASPEGVIHELVIEETDGARNSFQFSGEQPNAPAPAGAFVFTPPPGTHIVDGMPPI